MTETQFTVQIQPDGTKAKAKAGEPLADSLARAGVPLSLYCHKRGICGKCAVRIVSGPLSFPTPSRRPSSTPGSSPRPPAGLPL